MDDGDFGALATLSRRVDNDQLGAVVHVCVCLPAQVNPLLRAVELAKSGAHVRLMLPWLDPDTLRDE